MVRIAPSVSQHGASMFGSESIVRKVKDYEVRRTVRRNHRTRSRSLVRESFGAPVDLPQASSALMAEEMRVLKLVVVREDYHLRVREQVDSLTRQYSELHELKVTPG